MAFQTCYGVIPPIWSPATNTNHLLDASGEKVGFVFRAPATGNITGVEFMTNTVTTGDTLLISLQDVDTTTGDPDETADQSVTQVVGNADDNTKFAVTFGAARAVTKGDWVACVIEFNSFVAGNLNIRSGSNQTGGLVPALKDSYATLKTGGTWAKNAGAAPILSINYNGTYYPIIGMTPPTNSTVVYNSSDDPDEYALRFNYPVPVKVDGAIIYCDLDNDADFVLYDSDGSTPLATVAMDANIRSNTVSGIFHVRFAEVELDANTTYRAALKPGASDVTLFYVSVTAAGILAQLTGLTSLYLSHQTTGGGWTDVTTELPGIFLLQSAADDGTGGGGGAVLPPGSLSGGIFQ